MSLTNVIQQTQLEYQPGLWAQVLHQVPHVNISLHRLESARFRPDSEMYLESLGIIGSVPAIWLILTLVVLLIYLLTRCCDTKNNKRRKSRPMRCCLSFFALLCCTALAAGFWGNQLFFIGARQFSQASSHIARLVEHAQNQTVEFNDVLQRDVEQNLNHLYDMTFQSNTDKDQRSHYELMENSDFIFYNITDGLKAMDKIRLKINDPHNPLFFGNIPKTVMILENYRWPMTTLVLSLFVLFCLFLFVGAIVHSRATLICFSVCGLFSIICLWLLTSVYMTVAVALADLCYLPTPWVETVLANSYNLSADISDFYLRCNIAKQNPFQKPLRESQHAVLDIDRSVQRVSSISRKLYRDPQLNPYLDDLVRASARTVDVMGELNNSLKCDPLYRFYNDALIAACDNGLFGLLVMTLSAAVCAIIFTLLVWCNSHTWIYFKHKGKYIKVEAQDPYMPLSTIDRSGRTSAMSGAPGMYPRTRSIHTPPQTPPYHGGGVLNGHHGHPLAVSHNGTFDGKRQMGPPTLHPGLGAYGHVTTFSRAVPQGHATLGRLPKPPSSSVPRESVVNTMTLGRKGHYASLRGGRDSEPNLLGPNQGQYATLSKACKTLESSDFY